MNRASMRRLTGAFALASVVIWLGIFPLYVVQTPIWRQSVPSADRAPND